MTTDPLFDLIVGVMNDISEMEKALGVFDAVADNVAAINAAHLGTGFRLIQSLDVDYAIVVCGRLADTSVGSRSVSFKTLSREIRKARIKQSAPIAEWLRARAAEPASTDPHSIQSRFCDEFPLRFSKSAERIVALRDKFVAHRERTADWADIGANFSDVEDSIELAYQTIGAAAGGFLSLAIPPADLIRQSREAAERQVSSVRTLIDRALVGSAALE